VRGAFRTRRLTVATAIAAGVTTLLIAVLEPLRFAYEGTEIRVAIDTAISLVALLAAGLVLARYQRSTRLQDLALFGALTVLAGSNLLFAGIPAVVGAIDTNFAAWAPLMGSIVGAALLVASVVLPDQRMGDTRRPALLMFIGSLAALGAVAIAAAELSPSWDTPLPPGLMASQSSDPDLSRAGPAIANLVLMALYIVAAVGLVRRSQRDPSDPLITSFAVATPLAAASALNYALFPSLYPGWVYTGDILASGFYALLLVGAVRELVALQEQLAEAAVLRERRRIARNLHDGLAQELAFIVSQTRSLADAGGNGPFGDLAAAAERALDESRTAIAALTRDVNEPLDVALAQAAEEVAGRVGARVRFDLQRGVRVRAEVREDLSRIVREAVTNAARHGGAAIVTVSLENRKGVRVVIADDGHGFDPADPGRRGFGLTSMRERAQAVGGHLTIRSGPGQGTEVEVVIP
jgi:signal transduction histidine kinase